MNSQAELEAFVNLYRKLDKPEIQGPLGFSSIIVLTHEINEQIKEIYDLKLNGRGSRVSVESKDIQYKINDKDDLVVEESFLLGKEVTITVVLRNNEPTRFYESYNDFFNSIKNVENLRKINSYYIVDGDYCHSLDDVLNKPQILSVLDSVVFLNDKIKEISDNLDVRSDSTRAIFFNSDEGNVKPVVFSLNIDDDLMHVEQQTFSLLEELLDSENKNHEKIMLLKNALCEVMLKHEYNEKGFVFLFKNWIEIERAYHDNLEVYINGISFNKLKQEVEERHVEYIDDINTSIVDISVKIAVVPTTFALWLFFARTESFSGLKIFAFLICIFLMAVLFSFVLSGQLDKINFLKSSLKSYVNSFRKKNDSFKYETLIKTDIERDISSLENDFLTRLNSHFLWVVIGFFTLWAPVLIIFIFFVSHVYDFARL
jgi:hypothetical protein